MGRVSSRAVGSGRCRSASLLSFLADEGGYAAADKDGVMEMMSSLLPPLLPHDPARRPRCPFTTAVACQVEREQKKNSGGSTSRARRARGGYDGLPTLSSKSIPSPAFLPRLVMELSSSSPSRFPDRNMRGHTVGRGWGKVRRGGGGAARVRNPSGGRAWWWGFGSGVWRAAAATGGEGEMSDGLARD